MDNKHQGWARGTFVDGPRYAREAKEWKDEQRSREALLVRPAPLENAICQAVTPEAAKWIARRLNLAAAAEIVLATFEKDEEQGFRSKDRQYAISLLRHALPRS